MEIYKIKLSIIVPVYNVKQYIDKCITSILEQTFKDFELILVDDGSTDGSGEKCDEYQEKDTRIKVIHQKNQGQSVARNHAIQKARGEYIGFVDSDDWIEVEMLEKMMLIAYSEDADIAVCRLQTVSEKGQVAEITGYEENIKLDKVQATKDILLDELMRSYPVNKVYKKRLFEGVEFPINRYFEDTATIYKLIYKADKIVTTRYIGYNYRYNQFSTCNNKNLENSKLVKREYDNALAFGERYIFCKSDANLNPVRRTCANKAYMRMRSFIHMQVHKGIELTPKQQEEVDTIMKSFDIADLKDFSFLQKLDAVAYRYCKPLLYAYLKLLSLVHPMTRDL